MKRVPLVTRVLGAFLVVLFLSACTESSTSSRYGGLVQQLAPPTAPDMPTFAAIHLTGRGKQASSKFSLPAGTVTFRMKHTGGGNFAIWLLDSDGEQVDLLVNVIGQFDGSHAIALDRAGTYLLDVEANGTWNADVEPVAVAGAVSAPATLSGSSAAASQPLRLVRGLVTIQMHGSGKGNFAVWLLDGEHRIDLLANDIGAFDGSTAEHIPADGVYILDVEANGPWTISVD